MGGQPCEGFVCQPSLNIKTFSSRSITDLRAVPLSCSRRHTRSLQVLISCSEGGRVAKISVCNGPTCSKDGSANIRGMLAALGRDRCAVDETGCLGECGKGPNTVVFEPGNRPKIVRGIQSSTAACSLLRGIAVAPEDEVVSAIRLKEQADEAQINGDFSRAVSVYRDAAKYLRPFPQLYLATLCNWSKALVSAGDANKAVAVANQAVDFDPSRHTAWRRKAEAHQVAGERDAAMAAWDTWGRLSGRNEEAKRNVRSLKRRRIFGF